MAAPGVAGALALVRQYYTGGWYPSGSSVPGDAFTPSGALMKATLINSGSNMTGVSQPIPSNCQGWGRVLLDDSLHISGDSRGLFVEDDPTGFALGSSGDERAFPLAIASSSEPLKVTLAWTDYPSTPAANPHINNDLDLIVSGPSGTFLGNVFSGGESTSGGSADRLNSVEQVLIPNPTPGSYTVTVRSFTVPNGPQPFALVVSADLSGCSPVPIADAGADQAICAGESASIGSAAQGGHTYSWSPGGQTSSQVSVSPATTTLYSVTATTTCGSANDSVTVTVDTGAGGGLNDDFESGGGSWTTTGLWHLTNNSSCASPGYSSPTSAMYYGQDSGCNYDAGDNTGDLISSAISGVNGSSELSFDYYRQVEDYAGGSYDQAQVAVSVAGSGSWTTVWSRDSGDASASAWTASGAISLAAFAGESIQVRFRFDSIDGSYNTFTGWFIDDVVVTADSPCGGNTAPTVSITAPTNGTTVTEGDSLSFSGNASDAEDGSLTTSLFWTSSSDGAIGSGGSFSTSTLSVGSHTITASVTDSGGLGGSDSVGVTVLSSVDNPPTVTVTAPADGTSVTEGDTVNFTGTATDLEDDDTTLTAALSWNSSLDGAIGNGGPPSSNTLSVGTHTITASVTDSGGNPDSDSISLTVNPDTPGCADCVDWSVTGTVSYSNQDNASNVTVEDGGDTLLLEDNTWRRTTQTFAVTANTMLEVEFSSSLEGEIHGIGFDENDTLSDDVRIFQVHGTQNWSGSNHDFDNYGGGGSFVTYNIPVGQYYTGASLYLVLVNDNDAGSGNDSRFRNVRIYESTPSACAADVDFSSGASGWTNSASSSCSTGSFVAAVPTEMINGGVTTQVGGDHTTGSGNAFFSATNTSAGSNDVDGGTCVVESPSYGVTEASNVSIWYFHGQRDAGDDAGDFFSLEISTNGGGTWSTLASFGDEAVNAAWTEATTTVSAGDNVKFRVQVADGTAGGDLVEAGVDDLSICVP